MNYKGIKGIIVAGAIAIGAYLLLQAKKISDIAAERKTVQSGLPATTSAVTQKVAQKVDISKLPVQQIRYLIARAAAIGKTGKGVAALKAEEARRVAARKAAVQKAAAQKIGKIIGKKAAQKVVPQIREETGGRTGMALVTFLQKKAAAMHAAATQATQAVRKNSKIILPASKWAGGRTGMALVIFLKKREAAIAQALSQAKAAVPITKLFPGAEKSRVIPYKESSKHSYYGPKSHKLQNEGYMVKWSKKHNKSVEAYDQRKEQELLRNRKPWQT